jgi:hypothetical protein
MLANIDLDQITRPLNERWFFRVFPNFLRETAYWIFLRAAARMGFTKLARILLPRRSVLGRYLGEYFIHAHDISYRD